MTSELTTGGRKRGRNYTWPPFEPGNVMSLRHGAYSMRKRQPIEEAMVVWVHEAYPWLAEPRFAPAVAAWARAESMVLLLAAYVDEHGPIADDGKVLPAVAQLDRFERSAMAHRDRLGCDPTSALRMLRERMAAEVDSADLAAVVSAGRSAIEAREVEPHEDDQDDEGEDAA